MNQLQIIIDAAESVSKAYSEELREEFSRHTNREDQKQHIQSLHNELHQLLRAANWGSHAYVRFYQQLKVEALSRFLKNHPL